MTTNLPFPQNERELTWTDAPWGRHQVVLQSPEKTVKILEVYPGQALSLQYHSKRAESWVLLDPVVGVRFVINGNPLTPIQDVCYAVGERVVHRVVNEGPTVARVLEIITGEYDEEDIVRIHDRYGR